MNYMPILRDDIKVFMCYISCGGCFNLNKLIHIC